jgi:hypothetical protein
MNMYINQGRFGKFVTGFLEAEYERRKAEDEKDFDWKLWMMYINSITEKNFGEWKESVINNASDKTRKNRDDDLTEDGIKTIFDKLFPS